VAPEERIVVQASDAQAGNLQVVGIRAARPACPSRVASRSSTNMVKTLCSVLLAGTVKWPIRAVGDAARRIRPPACRSNT